MKQHLYYRISDNELIAFHEEDNIVFSADEHSEPIAFVEKGIWYAWKSHKPIAFEADDLVYDWITHKPLYVLSVE